MNDKALLKFHIGPVQSFIEAARTIRDLWTGSYLLSWLVFTAMEKAERAGAKILSPKVDGNPLLELTPCLPNHFEAEAPNDNAQAIASDCVRACCEQWEMIANKVRQRLKDKIAGLTDEWDRDWDQQVKSFFEVRWVVLPASDESHEMRMEQLHRLMDASRSVRHTPNYDPQPDAQGRFGMKCSVLGMFEQVGPAELKESQAFWDQLAGQGFEGTKLRQGERFCAISLVKRFAWPAYLAEAAGFAHRKNELRYSDTATVAAKLWLEQVPLNPDGIRRDHPRDGWSGQWLHWRQNPPRPDETDRGEETCPEQLWDSIQNAKRRNPVPTYYAVLMIDGDNVGSLLKEDEHHEISGRLSQFALKEVQPIIIEKAHAGELIYAGGDDVLAVTPTANALACARKLYDRYRAADVMGKWKEATMSAGVVIAHYKEDLRFVLEEARKAEREAKTAGRDKLVLRILRRSGEHAGVVLPWDLVAGNEKAKKSNLQQLVQAYIGDGKERPPSDRWAYKLRAEMPALQDSKEMFEAELKRLLGRLELSKDRLGLFRGLVMEVFAGLCVKSDADMSDADMLKNFVIACQSASFLARGRDE